MGMSAGDVNATSGMSNTIYVAIEREIIDKLHPDTPSSVKDDLKTQLKKLSFCIAEGVIGHIKSNMEIKGIKSSLDSPGLNGIFVTGVPVPQDGGAALKTAWIAATTGGTKDKSTQTNDGTGHVE